MSAGHAILKGVTPDMRTKLADAAKAYAEAVPRLQAAIIEAAAEGDNANQITEAIGFAYGPDYVRKLIRDARSAGKLAPRA